MRIDLVGSQTGSSNDQFFKSQRENLLVNNLWCLLNARSLLIDQWVHSLGFEKWSLLEHVAWQTFVHFSSFAAIAFWNAVCFWLGSQIICVQYIAFFHSVLFTVFEVYSSLLKHPLSVNHDLLHANLVYLYVMNNIYYHSIARDSYIIGGNFSRVFISLDVRQVLELQDVRHLLYYLMAWTKGLSFDCANDLQTNKTYSS